MGFPLPSMVSQGWTAPCPRLGAGIKLDYLFVHERMYTNELTGTIEPQGAPAAAQGSSKVNHGEPGQFLVKKAFAGN
jgi:hypothetical protein